MYDAARHHQVDELNVSSWESVTMYMYTSKSDSESNRTSLVRVSYVIASDTNMDKYINAVHPSTGVPVAHPSLAEPPP